MNDKTAVWNRAAMESGGLLPREGDRALSALLLVHGLVMNGGVFHAVEAVTEDELQAACAGFRYFGFVQVAELLEAATKESWTQESEGRFNAGYALDDEAIQLRFHEHITGDREKYAP